MANLPTVVTAPVTPIDPTKMTTDDAYALARAVAMSLSGIGPVLTQFKLTQAQYDAILLDDFYKRALDNATEEWNSIKGTQQRAVLKAAAVIEDGMIVMGGRLQDVKEPLTGVAQMAKVLGDFAGLGRSQQTPGAGEKVTISIDFGADTKLVVEKTIEGPEIQAQREGEGSIITLQPQREETSIRPPLRPQPERVSPPLDLFSVPKGD